MIIINNDLTKYVLNDGKASVYNAVHLRWIPGSGRFPGERNGSPLQYSCLENPMDGEAWCPWGRKESDTTERLNFHFHIKFYICILNYCSRRFYFSLEFMY